MMATGETVECEYVARETERGREREGEKCSQEFCHTLHRYAGRQAGGGGRWGRSLAVRVAPELTVFPLSSPRLT